MEDELVAHSILRTFVATYTEANGLLHRLNKELNDGNFDLSFQSFLILSFPLFDKMSFI